MTKATGSRLAITITIAIASVRCGKSHSSDDTNASAAAGGGGGGALGGDGGAAPTAGGASDGGAGRAHAGAAGAEGEAGAGAAGSTGGTAGAGGHAAVDGGGSAGEALLAGAAGENTQGGAGGAYDGPLPLCPRNGMVGPPGVCDDDSAARLAAVSLRLVAIENSSGAPTLTPGDDARIEIEVSTNDSAPADRIGLLAPDDGSRVTIQDGPCFAISDFGISSGMPQMAVFEVHLEPTLESGERVRFLSWATPYHNGCSSPLLEFDLVLD
jgi:hypothetical protein